MGLEYLFAGFAVFWAGIFVYVLLLQGRLRTLQRDIDRLEERLAESDAERAPTPPGGSDVAEAPEAAREPR